jgi:hypothetical protein
MVYQGYAWLLKGNPLNGCSCNTLYAQSTVWHSQPYSCLFMDSCGKHVPPLRDCDMQTRSQAVQFKLS